MSFNYEFTSAFGGIGDMGGLAAGSTRSQMTLSGAASVFAFCAATGRIVGVSDQISP